MERNALAEADAAQKIQHFATRLIRLARTTSKEHALSSAQYSAMALLAAHPGIAVVDLARREGVAHPTMSRLVAGLEKAGLVIRTKNPQDSRSSLITLTGTGERTYQDVAARRVMLFRMLLGQLSPGAVQEILGIVDRDMIGIEQALRAAPAQDM
jgi:DNA-binding MarR family transcriptional regulator